LIFSGFLFGGHTRSVSSLDLISRQSHFKTATGNALRAFAIWINARADNSSIFQTKCRVQESK
jgi:hypothetical protein